MIEEDCSTRDLCAITYLEHEDCGQHGIVCNSKDKSVVKVVFPLWLLHVFHVWLDLKVMQVALVVFGNAIATRGDTF